MNTPKPDDIRPGDPITAKFLNDSKNAGVHSVRVGTGLVGHQAGGDVTVSATNRPSASSNWMPQLMQVQSESGDYLKCLRLNGSGQAISGDVIEVGKPAELRGEWLKDYITPPYETGTQAYIWVGPMVQDGAVGSDGDLVLQDLNIAARRRLSVFPIRVSKVGGAAGDRDTKCSFTYDIYRDGEGYDAAEIKIAEGISPTGSAHIYKRPSLGKMEQATGGMARFILGQAEFTLSIIWINEIESIGGCT